MDGAPTASLGSTSLSLPAAEAEPHLTTASFRGAAESSEVSLSLLSSTRSHPGSLGRSTEEFPSIPHRPAVLRVLRARSAARSRAQHPVTPPSVAPRSSPHVPRRGRPSGGGRGGSLAPRDGLGEDAVAQRAAGGSRAAGRATTCGQSGHGVTGERKRRGASRARPPSRSGGGAPSPAPDPPRAAPPRHHAAPPPEPSRAEPGRAGRGTRPPETHP